LAISAHDISTSTLLGSRIRYLAQDITRHTYLIDHVTNLSLIRNYNITRERSSPNVFYRSQHRNNMNNNKYPIKGINLKDATLLDYGVIAADYAE
jgi:hypothetical protein